MRHENRVVVDEGDGAEHVVGVHVGHDHVADRQGRQGSDMRAQPLAIRTPAQNDVAGKEALVFTPLSIRRFWENKPIHETIVI